MDAIEFTFRVTLILLVAAISCALGGCREGGNLAVGTPEWSQALDRAAAYGLLDDDCRNDGVVWHVVQPADWDAVTGKHGAIGFATDDGVVYILAGGDKHHSESVVLRHEFLHCILQCSGYGDIQNYSHMGAVWDGWRAKEGGDR